MTLQTAGKAIRAQARRLLVRLRCAYTSSAANAAHETSTTGWVGQPNAPTLSGCQRRGPPTSPGSIVVPTRL